MKEKSILCKRRRDNKKSMGSDELKLKRDTAL